MRKVLKSILIGIVLIALGMIIKNTLQTMKKEVDKVDTEKVSGVFVTTSELKPTEEGITIIGYGNIEPRVILPITAEAAGKVTFINEDFLEGNLIKKNSLLFGIEKKDYEIAQKKALASLNENKASLELIKQEQKNIEKNIAINKRNLELVQKELMRYKSLIQERSVSPSDLDRKENEYQAALSNLTQNENSLALIPAKVMQAEAKIANSETVLEQAEYDLKRTEIYASFTGRILKKSVELGEYVNKGKVLGEMYDISTLEIKTPLSIQDLKWIMPEFYSIMASNHDQESVVKESREITVQLTQSRGDLFWYGKLLRTTSQVDIETRTLSAIVQIDETKNFLDNESVSSRITPPLLRGMFVKVKFKGFSLKNIYKIPRNLVSNENTVNIFEPGEKSKEGKLVVRPIDIVYIQKDLVYVSKGLQAGERLITTPVQNVVPGMKVSNY